MIIFCEDCGKKNLLTSIDFVDTRPTFRWSSCGYLNPYHFKPQENQILKHTNLFFEYAQGFSDILGSFLFHTEFGVLKNHMPEILTTTDLASLGQNLVKAYVAGRSKLGDVNEMGLAVGDKHMIVKMMGETLFMVIACKASILPREISEKLFPAG